MIERIDHVNIVVRDLPAMVAFYRDTLGLGLGREVTIRGEWIQTVTGLEEPEADVVYLEDASGIGLELIRYRAPQGALPGGLGEPNTMGLRHLAFRVSEIEDMAAGLQAAGAELLSQVQQVPAVQVDFTGRKKYIVYFRDPEGNLIELCEYR